MDVFYAWSTAPHKLGIFSHIIIMRMAVYFYVTLVPVYPIYLSHLRIGPLSTIVSNYCMHRGNQEEARNRNFQTVPNSFLMYFIAFFFHTSLLFMVDFFDFCLIFFICQMAGRVIFFKSVNYLSILHVHLNLSLLPLHIVYTLLLDHFSLQLFFTFPIISVYFISFFYS